MGLAEVNIVEHVEVAAGLAGLDEPDQRTFDHEKHLHGFGVIVGDERVRLARRLVDEVARRRDPVVLEIADVQRAEITTP